MQCSRFRFVGFYCVLIVVCGVWSVPASSQTRFTVTDLHTLGGAESYATAINKSGQVVGYSSTPTGQSAFLYSNGVMSGIGPTGPGISSQANGINDKGDIVGYAHLPAPADSPTAFFWHAGSTTLLSRPGYFTFAYAINNSGRIVGSSETLSGRNLATYWDNGVATEIGLQVSSFFGESGAYAVNDSGQIAGSAYVAGFIWQNGTVINYPGTVTSMNASGAGVGYYYVDAHPYFFQGNTSTTLNVPEGRRMYPYGINNANQIVGQLDQYPNTRAFLYENNQAIDLNTLIPANSGWALQGAQAINDAGQIVGFGTINGAIHAFLLTPTTLSSNLLALQADDAGTGLHDVAGIVCDNLANTPKPQQDCLLIPIPSQLAGVTLNTPIVRDALSGGASVDEDGNNSVGMAEIVGSEIRYYPPAEFNHRQMPRTGHSEDITRSATRTVYLTISGTKDGQSIVVEPKPIILARPPVVLVHGINKGTDGWMPLYKGIQVTKAVRVPFALVDHFSIEQGNGPVERAAYLLYSRIHETLDNMRMGSALTDGAIRTDIIDTPTGPQSVDSYTPFTDYVGLHLAVRRVDVAGWSYGGVIARWFIASDGSGPSHYQSSSLSWYKRGYTSNLLGSEPVLPAYDCSVRKLFTLGSMWRGVPLINYLNEVAFDEYPSSSGVYLGYAPVIRIPMNPFIPFPDVTTLAPLVDFFDSHILRTKVPSMEVMAVNSPWLSNMIFRDPFQRNHPLYPRPFDPRIAYGSVAGDNDAYLGHVLAPYALLDAAQYPSWFPYLKFEHLTGAERNYSDGLVPLWSSAIPGSYYIAPVSHSDYPGDSGTQEYLVQWLNNASLPTGDLLNNFWTSSVQSFDQKKSWPFRLEEMAPHAENTIYPQINGIGRITPIALTGTRNGKPSITLALSGTPVVGTSLSFNLKVSNSGTLAHDFRITSVTFYQSLLGTRFPYIVDLPPGIDLLDSTQTQTVTALSLNGFIAAPLFCGVTFQYYDQKGVLCTGNQPSIRLR
ncbi:MAG: hypothetical protein JWN14_155 [Chthonomonadales bacterium]|nr:hypothetical protein [Chthonomonadales bacterium]